MLEGAVFEKLKYNNAQLVDSSYQSSSCTIKGLATLPMGSSLSTAINNNTNVAIMFGGVAARVPPKLQD